MYAVVRVRGSVKTKREINDTLDMLKLKSVNHCVVVPEKETYLGMLKKAKDYITWGKIDKKTLKKLIEKRGNDKKDVEKDKPVFRLNPPRGGFKSTRLPYPKGDLGNRKEKINDLLERMI
jgi:large subunit ribosomal protein L30